VIVYSVRMEAPSHEVFDEIVAWLTDDHAGDVVRAGAIDASVVRLDADPLAVEVRYRFASREAFAAYEAGPALVLRAEGRERFGPERGVRMSRTIGEEIASRP
jgi:hypothetical protein